MNIGFWSCIVMVPCFWLLALFFALGGEKSTRFLSGFNWLPKEEQANYDRKRMAEDCRNDFLLWGVIMLAGAAFSWWVSGYIALAAWLIWLVLFFSNVHYDAEKAFAKYKITKSNMEKEKSNLRDERKEWI